MASSSLVLSAGECLKTELSCKISYNEEDYTFYLTQTRRYDDLLEKTDSFLTCFSENLEEAAKHSEILVEKSKNPSEIDSDCFISEIKDLSNTRDSLIKEIDELKENRHELQDLKDTEENRLNILSNQISKLTKKEGTLLLLLT